MKSNNLIKKNTLIEIISSLLLMLFLYTAVSKLIDFPGFIISMAKSPVIYEYAKPLAYIVPGTELIISILLFIPRTRKIALWCSLILMAIFSAYVAYMLLAHKTDLPCTCGGVLKTMSWPQHLVFNLFFTLLAGLGIYLYNKDTSRLDHKKILAA